MEIKKSHLPFSMPNRKHSLEQEWRHLSLLHWKVKPSSLEQHIPDELHLDLFDGYAYIGIIPFMMMHVRPRLAFSVPGISTFPEFNIRTYVKHNNKAGVYFFSLDAESRITCFYAPRAYGLPYRYAKGKLQFNESTYKWSSIRRSDAGEIRGSCTAYGEPMVAKPHSLEHFLLERYCLYTMHKRFLNIGYVYHEPWVFRKAKAKIISNTIAESLKLEIKDPMYPDFAYVSNGVSVNSWSLEKVKN